MAYKSNLPIHMKYFHLDLGICAIAHSFLQLLSDLKNPWPQKIKRTDNDGTRSTFSKRLGLKQKWRNFDYTKEILD